jgi:peptide deformylase
VGLAAPQINDCRRVFIVDSRKMYNEISESQRKAVFSGDKGIEETFINAKILASSEETWKETEGCLSIPGILENVERAWEIIVEYNDIQMNSIRKQFSGYTARVIQHEMDHTQGILFIDHLPPLTKKLLQGKLRKIRNGKEKTYYALHYTN